MGLIAVLAETGAARRLLQQAAGTGVLTAHGTPGQRPRWTIRPGQLADASLVGFAGYEDRDRWRRTGW